jgi:hypothetical protein
MYRFCLLLCYLEVTFVMVISKFNTQTSLFLVIKEFCAKLLLILQHIYLYICSLSTTDAITMCMCLYTCLHQNLKMCVFSSMCTSKYKYWDLGLWFINRTFMILLLRPKHTIYSSGHECDWDNSVMGILNSTNKAKTKVF